MRMKIFPVATNAIFNEKYLIVFKNYLITIRFYESCNFYQAKTFLGINLRKT